MVTAVVLAVLAALCYAVAAALEQHQAAGDSGSAVVHPGLLLRLVRRPLWLIGFAVGGLGAALHLVALTAGPLTTVQPVGVLVVVFAVPIGALLRRRRPAVADVLAGGGVAAGLAMVMATLHTTAAPTPPGRWALAGVAAVAAVALAVGVAARRLRPRLAAPVLAVACATLLGLSSALVRLITESGHGVSAFLRPATLLLVGCAAAGTLLEQSAYKVGRLAAVVAIATVVDPLASIGLSAGLLGQGVSVRWPALAIGAAPLVLAGLLVLARRLDPGPRAVAARSAQRVPAVPAVPPPDRRVPAVAASS